MVRINLQRLPRVVGFVLPLMVVASAAGIIPPATIMARARAVPDRQWVGRRRPPALDTLAIPGSKTANAKLD